MCPVWINPINSECVIQLIQSVCSETDSGALFG